MSESEKSFSRRDVLKTVTIGSGIVVSKWSTPVVEGIMVPAHAEMTFGSPPQGFDQTTVTSFSVVGTLINP